MYYILGYSQYFDFGFSYGSTSIMIFEVAGSFEIEDKCGYNCTGKLKCCIYKCGYELKIQNLGGYMIRDGVFEILETESRKMGQILHKLN